METSSQQPLARSSHYKAKLCVFLVRPRFKRKARTRRILRFINVNKYVYDYHYHCICFRVFKTFSQIRDLTSKSVALNQGFLLLIRGCYCCSKTVNFSQINVIQWKPS